MQGSGFQKWFQIVDRKTYCTSEDFQRSRPTDGRVAGHALASNQLLGKWCTKGLLLRAVRPRASRIVGRLVVCRVEERLSPKSLIGPFTSTKERRERVADRTRMSTTRRRGRWCSCRDAGGMDSLLLSWVQWRRNGNGVRSIVARRRRTR